MSQDCPIGYTCPKIDEVIDAITSVRQTVKAIKDKLANTNPQGMSPDMWVEFLSEIKDEAEDIEYYIRDTESQMEGLRTANEQLREWGLDANNNVEVLENTISDLNDKVESLEKDIIQ